MLLNDERLTSQMYITLNNKYQMNNWYCMTEFFLPVNNACKNCVHSSTDFTLPTSKSLPRNSLGSWPWPWNPTIRLFMSNFNLFHFLPYYPTFVSNITLRWVIIFWIANQNMCTPYLTTSTQIPECMLFKYFYCFRTEDNYIYTGYFTRCTM
jgi:hypothetical protein